MVTKLTERAMGALFVFATTLVVAVACGGSGSGGSTAGGTGSSSGNGGAGAAGGSSSTNSGGAGAEGGGATNCSPPDCSDGLDCTTDSCNAGACVHTPGPCPAGEYCDLSRGCVAAPPCASVMDCERAWAGDACKTNLKCDGATAVCTFELLDKDQDGHAPVVCGGGDCNDASAAIKPGATELCDAVDDDCNGTPDNGAACQTPALICLAGQCVCAPENLCDGDCTELQIDPQNCGSCGSLCPFPKTCSAGVCSCPPMNQCGASCVDTSADPNHCGMCGNACPPNSTCSGGTCACQTQGETVCDDACTNTGFDNQNCGFCGNVCPLGEVCVLAACGPPDPSSGVGQGGASFWGNGRDGQGGAF